MRPKRERESGVFGAIAQSSWFRGAAVDDESGEKQLRAICVIIAVEFGLPLSTVRGYVDSDKSIDDIACAHLFFTEQSEAHLSDREKGKERARRQCRLWRHKLEVVCSCVLGTVVSGDHSVCTHQCVHSPVQTSSSVVHFYNLLYL